MNQEQQPTVPHNQSLAEITIKGTIVAIFLTVILAASNIYLGLKVGMTISASIPAAVLSMGILRWFKSYSVLENNIVQTCVSCGEGLAGGVIYSIPALLILKYWFHFDYFYTVIVSMLGGLLGVLFSIPLRPVLLADKTLRFPEGIAIGKVLQASAEGASHGFKFLVGGGLIGGLISFCQSGLEVISDSASFWFVKNKAIYGIGFGFSPALIAAGYIIGIAAAVSILVGIVIVWLIGMPILSTYYGDAVGTGLSAAMSIWSQHIRYIGVGTLMVGGLWTIIKLIKPISQGLHKAFVSLREKNQQQAIRTERDIKINRVLQLVGIIMIPVCFLMYHFISQASLDLSSGLTILLLVALLVTILILSFIVTALCGYFSGLVGATNSPVSAMSISSVLLIALIMLAILAPEIRIHNTPSNALHIGALAILALSFIACAGAISTDVMQDLKAGQMVGATPWKQQVMLFLGVIIAALVIPPILNLLLNAYGIGGVFPRAGMDHSNMLTAPQAALMANIVEGVFGKGLNWAMILTGMSLGFICIVIDEIISRKGYRLHSLAVGLGVYLPITTTSSLVIGGFISYFVNRRLKAKDNTPEAHEKVQQGHQRATLLACGLVAGSTLMGVILAIPFVIYQSSDALAIMPKSLTSIADVLGILTAIFLVLWIYRVATKNSKGKS